LEIVSNSSIDPTPYLRPPRFGVRSGLSLAKALLTVVPPRPGRGVLEAADALATATTTLETAWKAQSQPRRLADVRPFDLRLDRAWAVVSASLERYSIFPADDPDRTSAAALHERLFPSGLAFLRLPYPEQHAESQRLLDLVVEEDLRAELDRLVGEVFLDELRLAHVAYGEALGITKPTPVPAPAVSLVEPLRALADAITAYVVQVLAFAGLDPDSHTAAARRALEPIDRFRRAAARRNASTSTTPAADAPAELVTTDPEDVELPEGFPAPDAELPTRLSA
jgi:hypothetical protein